MKEADDRIHTRIPWPHAPIHQLSVRGTYFITAGTYLKIHHFRKPSRLDDLLRAILETHRQFGWQLEAWAVFSNHYHVVAHSPSIEDDATSLPVLLRVLHTQTARSINRLDRTPNRQVWQNFWDTRLTYQRSYLARLNYVHQNAVKHQLVPVANQYPWCSAAWFERTATSSQIKSIYRFKWDKVQVRDEYEPVL